MIRAAVVLAILAALVLAIGTWRDPHFWQTANRQGDRFMEKKAYRDAEKAYAEPWRLGVAQYRNGDFEAAAGTFARVPGATGAFDQGNALLMHGKYDAAVESYDRALGFQPGWKEAEENRAIAIVRRDTIANAGKERDQESAEAYKPDEVTYDQKGENQTSPTEEMNGEKLSDAELRATWLRRVQTTPADFLRAKFSYQAAHETEAKK